MMMKMLMTSDNHHDVVDVYLSACLPFTSDLIVILMNNEKYLFPAAVIMCISVYDMRVLKKFSCEICIITAFEIRKAHF